MLSRDMFEEMEDFEVSCRRNAAGGAVIGNVAAGDLLGLTDDEGSIIRELICGLLSRLSRGSIRGKEGGGMS